MPQLKIVNSEIIPIRIKSRLDELGMTEQMLMDLLKIYESVREEYIELLKKGFLVFFPYLLGTRWREHYNNRYSNRNLVIYIFEPPLDLVKGSYFKEDRLFFSLCKYVL